MNKFRKYLINHFDVISFDIFDTLIGRNVDTPQEIFRLTGRDVLGDKEADTFTTARCEAEKRARAKRADGEVTLLEIYEEIKPVYKEKTERLMRAEVTRELTSCHPKQKNVEWMKRCIEKGKKVFLISDMYLPFEVIKEMLDCCGIRGYQKLYISNIYRRNKVKGDLFRIVIKENHLESMSKLHVGDSPRADIMGAYKAGIFAIWLPKEHSAR